MEFEKIDVPNGAEEREVESEEKILKPRKSVSANEQRDGIIQNGKNENGSVSENENVENGYDENGYDNEDEETNKQHKRRSRQHGTKEKKESTPRKSLKIDSRASTPKQDTPTKRELRRRETTPKESTPKPELRKRESKRSGTPAKLVAADHTEKSNIIEEDEQNDMNEKNEFVEDKKPMSNEKIEQETDTSVLILDETEKNIDEDLVVNVDDSEDYVDIDTDDEETQEISLSDFQKSSENKSSNNVKDTCEASSSSSPSVICLGTPSVSDVQYSFSSNVKGRKAINSFSRFPGRVVSNTSIDKSLKRKADDDSFTNDGDRKRYAGDTESGSEKSPGWNFFSSFNRVWSPSSPSPKKAKSTLQSSTPFHRITQDSMAVNYDEESKLSLDDSKEIQMYTDEDPASKSKAGKFCTIM